MKLGVFDSGIGGQAVAVALQSTFPESTILVINDRAHIPYGDKTADEVISLTDAAIQPLLSADCDAIILACNTATALAIEPLRIKYPQHKFVGIEPMVKTASRLTKSRTITVCATPATLASDRYNQLVEKFGQNINIIEPDCSNWAQMIENNKINHRQIKQTIDESCAQGSDIIVLGCTHYHWIKDLIIELSNGRAQVIEPSEAIGKRLKSILKTS